MHSQDECHRILVPLRRFCPGASASVEHVLGRLPERYLRSEDGNTRQDTQTAGDALADTADGVEVGLDRAAAAAAGVGERGAVAVADTGRIEDGDKTSLDGLWLSWDRCSFAPVHGESLEMAIQREGLAAVDCT
jgi:hypothetical protein